jgi:hypothetical protein
MTHDEFLERYRRALDLTWKAPPEDATRVARRRPDEHPLPEPPPGTVPERLSPADIRSAGVEEAMISRSLPGIDVTFQVIPPEGDGLWVVEGRFWLSGQEPGTVHVALVQGDHVLAETAVAAGQVFRFEDLLVGGWSLEFHLPDGRVAVLSGSG